MAKYNGIIPNVLGCMKRIEVTPASFYGINSKSDIQKENPLTIVRRGFLATKSNYGTKEENAAEPNPQASDYCNLDINDDILRIKFNITFLPVITEMFNFSSEKFDEKISKVINEYKQIDNFETLATMYVMNIISMRFAYRNIAGGHVPYKLSLHQEIGPNEYGKIIDFTKDDFGKEENGKIELNKFDISKLNVDIRTKIKEIIDLVKSAFMNEIPFVKFLVKSDIYFGDGGVAVYPSQEIDLDTSDKSRKFYKFGNTAALHSEKVGNAIRTIDIWYKKDDNMVMPLPVNPFAVDKRVKEVYRKPYNNDFFTLEVNVIDKDVPIMSLNGDAHYFMASLIRGGLYNISESKDS